ncbi:MAG: hypothetical protein ABIO16_17070 [Nocardioides sp.]
MHRPIPRTVVVLVVALLLVAAGLGVWRWRATQGTEFSRAVAAAPAGTERVSWTDWDAVRRRLGADVDARSGVGEVRGFLDDGFSADLTSTSALVQSAPVLQQSFGFSPASAEWELFSQSKQGAVVTVRMPDGTDFGDLGDRLEELGLPRPSSDDGVWAGGPDLLSRISSDLTPELGYVALLADDHLVMTSDQAAYLRTAVDAVHDDGPRVSGLDAVTDAVGSPLTAAVYAGDYACGALAMAQADANDQAEAAQLVAAAGTVDPYLAFAMARLPADGDAGGGLVRVAMEFENDDQARTNADSRAALASGPAVGQGGDFSDRFILADARTDGSVVKLDLIAEPRAAVLGDLSTGPVLFATC